MCIGVEKPSALCRCASALCRCAPTFVNTCIGHKDGVPIPLQTYSMRRDSAPTPSAYEHRFTAFSFIRHSPVLHKYLQSTAYLQAANEGQFSLKTDSSRLGGGRVGL